MSTAEIRRHWDMLAQRYRCLALICHYPKLRCGAEPTMHHAHGASMKERGIHKAKGMKTSDWLTIPLCHFHHVGAEGIDGTMGVQTWEKRYGTQADMLDYLCEATGIDLWARAAAESKGMVPRLKLV